jgi:GntR family transcriptional regulator
VRIQVSLLADTPAYEQIKTQIKEAILTGILPGGAQLPSLRLLAKELSVALITVKRAYEELEKENLIVSVQGKGCYVNNIDLAVVKKIHLQMLEERLADIKKFAETSGLDVEDVQKLMKKIWGEADDRI